jgi:fumarate reductase subunit D
MSIRINSQMTKEEVEKIISMAARSIQKGSVESDVAMAIFSEIHRLHGMTDSFEMISRIKLDTQAVLSVAKGGVVNALRK